MKGIIIFNKYKDVIFMHYDESFKHHVNKIAYERGLIEESQINESPECNAIVQIFSPLVMSHSVMEYHLKNPYRTVQCQDNTIFAFRMLLNASGIAINGDGEEDSRFLHRKLLILQQIIILHYGPNIEEISGNTIEERYARWKNISNCIDAWVNLYNTEHCFLVEAVEKLNVNEHLSRDCLRLLEKTMEVMKTAGDKNIAHALITVGTKLLSLHSSKNSSELNPSDILLLILLTQSQFPSKLKLEDLFSRLYVLNQSENSVIQQSDLNIDVDCFESALEDNDDDDEDDEEEAVDNFDLYNYPQKTNHTNKGNDSKRNESNDEKPQNLRGINIPNVNLNGVFSTLSIGEREETYSQQTVFLNSPSCPYTPYFFHCIQILPGVNVLLISEISRSKQIGSIYQILHMLDGIFRTSDKTTLLNKSTIDLTDSNLKKIQDMLQKLKGSPSLSRVMKNAFECWSLAKDNGFLSYFEHERLQEIPVSLETNLEGLQSNMFDLFKKLYLLPWRQRWIIERNIDRGIHYVRDQSLRTLYDYKDYLNVKAVRNVTITASYIEDFPGLAHFVYVNRALHQMVVPSINITEEDNPDSHNTILKKIKQNFWLNFPKMQEKLQDGCFSQSIREGDYLFTYILWFEGNPSITQQPPRLSLHDILPGIIVDNFYKSLQDQCAPAQSSICFELVTVHFGLVPPQFVRKQCCQLASKLADEKMSFMNLM